MTTAGRLFAILGIFAFASLITLILRPHNANFSSTNGGVSVLQNEVTIAWNQASMSALPPEDAKAIAEGVKAVQDLAKSWNDDCLKIPATNGHMRSHVKYGTPPQRSMEIKIAFDEFCGGDIEARGSQISEVLRKLKERFSDNLQFWYLAVDIIFDLVLKFP